MTKPLQIKLKQINKLSMNLEYRNSISFLCVCACAVLSFYYESVCDAVDLHVNLYPSEAKKLNKQTNSGMKKKKVTKC